MSLNPENLREIDESILNLLTEGRITPVYGRDRLVADHDKEVTSTYVGQRLGRLVEHGHVRNLLDAGLYELVEDPRDSVESV